MSFPLKQRRIVGYRFGVPTSYSNFHLGTDYDINPDRELFAPFDGEIIYAAFGSEAGNMIQYKTQGVIMRFMHLKEFRHGVGPCKKGDLIGICDNTGLSTGEHLHLDIWTKGGTVNPLDHSGFIDPEGYNWNKGDTMSAGDDLLDWIVNHGKLEVYGKAGQPDQYLTFKVRDPHMLEQTLQCNPKDNKVVDAYKPSELQAEINSLKQGFSPINETLYRKNN